MRSLYVSLGVLGVVSASLWAGCDSPAASTTSAAARAASTGTCMQDVWQQHGNTQALGCSANDVSVARAVNIRGVDGQPLGQCISGQTFSFVADFDVRLTSTQRFDIGLYFATDGDSNHDGALTGTCSGNIIQPASVDPVSGITFGSPNFIQLDPAPDKCGDIDSGHNPQIVTVRVDNVLCQDTDGDGLLNLPNCTSWRQPGSNAVCQTSNDAFPGSPSKCHCDVGFNVPLRVENGLLTATKAASPTSLPEPGGAFTYTISTTNVAQFTTVTVNSICDNRYGTIAGAGCAPGSVGAIDSTTCTVPQVLAPGQTVTCSFVASLAAADPTTLTDTVTFSGIDGNGKPVSAAASAQIAVTDVPPTALVVKSFFALLGSDVREQVTVQNTSAFDAQTLTQLLDSVVGDITTVQGNLLATTCAVPQVIPIGGAYTCTFDVHFSGATSTDTITATLNDGEGNAVVQPSNALTVNVTASGL